MAYNPFGQDTGVEDFSGSDVTAEERKRKLAMLASLAGGQGLGDVAGKMIGERVAPIANAIEYPEEALKQRFGEPIQRAEQIGQLVQGQQPQGPVGPVMPQEVAQQRQLEELQPKTQMGQVNQPVIPGQEVAQQTQLPQAGPATQVAGPVPQQATIDKTALDDVYHNAFVEASNSTDAKQRRAAFAQLIGNPNVPEGLKTQANQAIVDDYQKTRAQQQAMEKIQNATPTELARYMQEKGKDEGSYVKAILFHRLGLTELAKQEQEKLSPNLKAASATDSTTGQRYTVYRNQQGEITKAFNTEGNLASQEEVARLSAATLPTQAHQLPSVHGSPVINAQGETGLLMYDPQSQSSYVQVGNKRLPTAGWTTMAQNIQNVYGAAQAQQLGKGAGEGFTPQPMKPLPGQVLAPAGTVPTTPAVNAAPTVSATSGATPEQRIQGDIAGLQREIANTPSIPANQNRLAILRQELDKARQQSQIVSQQPGVPGAGIAQQKANLEIEQARIKEEQKPAAEAKGKETAASIKKQAFADNAYPIVKELGSIIKESTGSGIGASVDDLAAAIGSSPKGAQAIAKLETFASPLVSMVPRFEGSQSDRDVQMYQKQAGDFANPKLPIATRLAALQGMVKLLQIYDKEGANDWGALQGYQEKTVNGVTYIYDGKGWKKK